MEDSSLLKMFLHACVRRQGNGHFAPETVEHIQAIIKSRQRPDRVIETPVYDYA